MNREKVTFAFVVLLALTLNFGFYVGDIDDPGQHSSFELFAALIVSIIATLLKVGDHTQPGALLLAASLVADLQLIAASMLWAFAVFVTDGGMTPSIMASIVSLSGGALLANIVSTIILIVEMVLDRL
jgi:hypothetical protein